MHRIRVLASVCLVAATVALFSSACGSQSGTAPAAMETSPAPAVGLPERVQRTHTIVVATNAFSAPNEFLDSSGRLSGFDIDTINAIAKSLGVQVKLQQVPFADLLPGVARGDYDIAMRSLFDTKERERAVDMVTYFSAGTMWAQRAGDSVDPNAACGKRVGGEVGTVQFRTELTAKSLACKNAGMAPLTAVPFNSQSEAVAALQHGDVDAVSADSPVTLYSIRQSAGKLTAAGEAFDTEPYAMAVAKESALAAVLQSEVQHLIDSGRLAQIADHWGVGQGLVRSSMINGATS